MALEAINEALTQYVRPQSSPVAIKMLTADDDLPSKTKIPRKDLGLDISICHGILMTRRYGWMLGVDTDQTCWVGALGMGFVKLKPDVADGTLQESLGLWGHSKKQAADLVSSFSKLDYGRYDRILMAPIEKASFEPDVILVYGMPAQVWVLVSAYLLATKGFTMDAKLHVGAGCTTYIAKTMLTDMPQFGLIGIGERFSNAQDHECVISIPYSKIDLFIDGLIQGKKGGSYKYPTVGNLKYNTEHPAGYDKMLAYLKE